jgi:FixJ family two-component response regulator
VRLNTLTSREREVLEHVAAGKLNKQIARDLGITEATIKMHRARVVAKMKVQSVAGLARLVERCGDQRK